MEDLIIRRKQENNVLTVFAEGRIDNQNSPQFSEEVKPYLNDVNKLVFDLEKLIYISSAGLRVLLDVFKCMTENAVTDLVIRKPTEIVFEALEVTGIADLYNIEN